jgi:transcriptional regulator with XRE-family HTH domain
MILKKLGTNIKVARLQLKLSQEALSFASGLDRSYIGSVERGERNISIINLCKIAAALQISPSTLLDAVTLSLEQHE